jgi:4-hydroxy-L-threonine phosphate dehydrogenase PdxA
MRLLRRQLTNSIFNQKIFSFAGHTEYLEHHFNDAGALMLMISEQLRVGVVAGHVPMVKLSEYITEERILKKLRILNNSLIKDLAYESRA